jgi:hypothetical protein
VDFFAVTAQVRLWHKADMPFVSVNVRFWGLLLRKMTIGPHFALRKSLL